MKQINTIIFCVLLFSTSVFANVQTPQFAATNDIDDIIAACEETRNSNFPAHYCVCTHDYNRFIFPIDSTLTDSVWYKGGISTFINQGITAYVYGDCGVRIDLYQNCKTSNPTKSYEVEPNQTCDVDGETLQQKLEEAGLGGFQTSLYICVYPLEEGADFRFICNPYNEGPISTCDNPFPVIPGMTFVSSHSGDVYELDPNLIPENSTASIQWTSNSYCTLEITRGSCDADVLIDASLGANASYTIDANLLKDARDNNEKIYLHFWDHYRVGRIRLNVKSNPSTPTGCDNLIAPNTDARLVLDQSGLLYIERDGVRYTLTGSRL